MFPAILFGMHHEIPHRFSSTDMCTCMISRRDYCNSLFIELSNYSAIVKGRMEWNGGMELSQVLSFLSSFEWPLSQVLSSLYSLDGLSHKSYLLSILCMASLTSPIFSLFFGWPLSQVLSSLYSLDGLSHKSYLLSLLLDGLSHKSDLLSLL